MQAELNLGSAWRDRHILKYWYPTRSTYLHAGLRPPLHVLNLTSSSSQIWLHHEARLRHSIIATMSQTHSHYAISLAEEDSDDDIEYHPATETETTDDDDIEILEEIEEVDEDDDDDDDGETEYDGNCIEPKRIDSSTADTSQQMRRKR